MKYLYSILLLLILISCKEKEQPKIIKSKVDLILDDIINKHPNITENDFVLEKANKYFKSKIDTILNYESLKNIPLRILSINKNPHGKGALIHFYTENLDYSNNNNLSNKLNFDLLCLTEENIATKLKQNEIYYLQCNKLNKIGDNEVSLLVSQTYFENVCKIKRDDLTKNISFNLGTYLGDINKIESLSDGSIYNIK